MTYSIIGRNPETGELGIAVQSRYFAAGRIVTWIESGAGVVASQSFANPVYGYETLRLLRSGLHPEDILQKLLTEDAGAAMRQVAILDAQGRVAVYTGAKCVSEAGHAIGVNCCAQANMMERNTVWKAMVQGFEHARGELPDRLLAAMEAAENEGGDVRGKQAAALIVAPGKPSGIPQLDRLIDLRVDDHPDPVVEVRRMLSYSRAHKRADNAVDRIASNDFPAASPSLTFVATHILRNPSSSFAGPWFCSQWNELMKRARCCSERTLFILGGANFCSVLRMQG